MQAVKFSRGFTLIEGMVSLLVISIGLLGTLALQSSMIGRTMHSNNQTVAASHASNMVARIRAQAGYWQAVPVGFGVAVSAAGAITDSADATVSSATALHACATSSCATPNAEVAQDLRLWALNPNGSSAAERLGNTTLTVDRIGNTLPPLLQITVSWDRKRAAGGIDMSSGYLADAVEAANYSLRVHP